MFELGLKMPYLVWAQVKCDQNIIKYPQHHLYENHWSTIMQGWEIA